MSFTKEGHRAQPEYFVSLALNRVYVNIPVGHGFRKEEKAGLSRCDVSGHLAETAWHSIRLHSFCEAIGIIDYGSLIL